jgi:hypothetical protein
MLDQRANTVSGTPQGAFSITVQCSAPLTAELNNAWNYTPLHTTPHHTRAFMIWDLIKFRDSFGFTLRAVCTNQTPVQDLPVNR